MSEVNRVPLKVDRSTPLESFDELYEIYGTRDHNSIPFLGKVKEMQSALREVMLRKDLRERGVVLSVEGTWGSGKTTFMNLALAELEDENVMTVKYDSLFYGNVSEATNIFIGDIFKKIGDTFGVELRDSGIARNITPKFEISNGLPRFNLDFDLTKQRYPTELIKENIASKLKKIDGKVVVVIDDLDRVSGEDVVHFLRIVRVLRELPNFIVVLPVDKKALEDLLSASQIASPRKYLEKIIDWSIGVDPEMPSTRTLLMRKVSDNTSKTIDQSSLEDLWRMILLELAFYTLDTEEMRGTGANIGVGKADQTVQQYERKARSLAAGGDSLMRAFFDRTNTQYGAGYNLVTKVVNSAAPDRIFFRSYTSLYSGQNFIDFLKGQTSSSLSGTERLEDPSQNLMKTQWWRDADYIMSLNGGTQDQTYDVQVATLPAGNSEEINTQLNTTAITLWDELRNIIEAFYPYEGLRYLAPRSVNKIVAALNMDIIAELISAPLDDSDKRMNMYVQVKYAVGKALKEV